MSARRVREDESRDSLGLGEEFLEELQAGIAAVQAFPESLARMEGHAGPVEIY